MTGGGAKVSAVAAADPARADEPPDVTNVPDLLLWRATTAPDVIALRTDAGATLTYDEWERRSSRVAAALVRAGVARGDRVALVFDEAEGCDYAVAYLGVQKARAVVVPMSLRAPVAERAAVVEACGVSWLVFGQEEVEAPGAVRRTSLRALVDEDAADVPLERPAFDDLAHVLYTSGTTGKPKGIAVPHGNLTHEFNRTRHEFASSWSDGLAVHAFPLTTNGAQMSMIAAMFMSPSLKMGRFDPKRFLALVEELRVRTVIVVPTMAEVLVRSQDEPPRAGETSSVEVVLLTSSALSPALARRVLDFFPNATLVNEYSSTEAVPAETRAYGGDFRPGYVGHPIPGSRVRITDEDAEELPPGEIGHVWLLAEGSPQRWYFGDPELTASVFRDGWARTGDLGYLEEDGGLVLLDRADDTIIVGGLNVSSLEVEAALREHPAVDLVAVVGVPHPILGSCVAAAIVPRKPVAPDEIRDFAAERLASEKVPQHVKLVDELPTGNLGKVRKREVRELFASG